MAITYLFAGVAVADYEQARAWYTRLFGRSPDVIVTENECMWQIVGAGWIYVVGDASRAGSALITLLVENLDEQVAALQERGFVPPAIETVPGAYRKIVLLDPEGNSIAFGESLSGGE